MDMSITISESKSWQSILTSVTPFLSFLGGVIAVVVGEWLRDLSERRREQENLFNERVSAYRNFANVFTSTSSNLLDLWDAALNVVEYNSMIKYPSNGQFKSIEHLLEKIEELMLIKLENKPSVINEFRVNAAREIIPILSNDLVSIIKNKNIKSEHLVENYRIK